MIVVACARGVKSVVEAVYRLPERFRVAVGFDIFVARREREKGGEEDMCCDDDRRRETYDDQASNVSMSGDISYKTFSSWYVTVIPFLGKR